MIKAALCWLVLLATAFGEVVVHNIDGDQVKRSLQGIDPAATCADFSVNPCQYRLNRDLLFIVDASESLDPARFHGEMLDYTQALFCAFDTRDRNKAGMIMFNKNVRVEIPLAFYTREEWFAKVEEIRAKNLPVNCCTPTAEAFALAEEVFRADPEPGDSQIAFIITDGSPYQNSVGPWGWPKIQEGQYQYKIVPAQAKKLKEIARLFLVGVPNAKGRAPETKYFAGIKIPSIVPKGGPANLQCSYPQRGDLNCEKLDPNLFPITSEPVAENLFSSNTWDVASLLTLTVENLCRLPPTRSPTNKPTVPPSPKPTVAPTNKPTNAPTNKPTSLSPTRKPTNAPTKSPTQLELSHLDLYILLDRSRSMRWMSNLCKSAPGGVPDAIDQKACWLLFLNFANSLVENMLKYAKNGRVMGWQGSQSDVARGLRVTLMAYACDNHQSDPLVFPLGDLIDSQEKWEAAMQKARDIIPDGGTCPGAAIDRVVRLVQNNQLLERPFKAILLATDGVFFDGDAAPLATRGLRYFGVETYALGLALGKGDYEDPFQGMTPEEKKTQRQQLRSFVGSELDHLFNFGKEGIQVLQELAKKIADQLPKDILGSGIIDKLQNRPFFCGYATANACTFPGTVQADKCKWVVGAQKSRCMYKYRCDYLKGIAACETDQYCKWIGNEKKGRCGPKSG